MGDRRITRYFDSEGICHFTGPGQAVNAGLCGNNDSREATGEDVDCLACLAIYRYVKSDGRQE